MRLRNTFQNIANLICNVAIIGQVLCSCHSTSHIENEKGLFPVKEYTELSSEQLYPDLIMKTPIKLLTIEDNLLIAQFRYDSIIQVINLENKVEPYMIAPKGPGPHEFYDLMNMLYISADSLLAIHDANLRKYAYYRISQDKISLDHKTFAYSDFLKKKVTYTLAPFGEGYIQYSITDGKMFERTDREFNTMEAFGDYPGVYPVDYSDLVNEDAPILTNDYFFKLGHQAHMLSNPQLDRLVVAGMWSDWLAFYRQGEEGMELVKEYFTYDSAPKVTRDPLDVGVQEAIGARHSERFNTFQDLYATENHFYVLYYGFYERDMDNPDSTCYILQFSWDGEFQKAYHLQEVISHFAVDEKRSCIYATYTPKGEDPVLLKYEIE